MSEKILIFLVIFVAYAIGFYNGKSAGIRFVTDEIKQTSNVEKP
jgi:hypothetical protein